MVGSFLCFLIFSIFVTFYYYFQPPSVYTHELSEPSNLNIIYQSVVSCQVNNSKKQISPSSCLSSMVCRARAGRKAAESRSDWDFALPASIRLSPSYTYTRVPPGDHLY